MPAAAQPTRQISPAQQNAMIRQAILSSAVRLRQPVYNQAWNPAQSPQINIPPKFIGLLRRFTVIITGTFTNNDSVNAATVTDLGLAALLDPNSGVVLSDLNGYNRIQTGLWHLLMVESVKRQKLYASRFLQLVGSTPWENPGTWAPMQQPTNLTASGGSTPSSTFRMQFDVPVSYMPDDLRGAIWISVVNATMQLTLNYNQNAFTAIGGDSTFSVYYGTTNISLSGVNVNILQDYLDQLPVGQDGQPALPIQDISTVYELKKTQFPNIAAGVENPFPFTNLRRFLSTTAVYDSSPGTAPPNRFNGSDVSYWALQTASQLYLWKLDPQQFSEMFRHLTGWDLPNGFYYFDHRRQPIYTPTYGNMQILLNPISALTGAIVHLGYEDFADVNLLTQASSLPAGN